jgi:hypothetical protein
MPALFVESPSYSSEQPHTKKEGIEQSYLLLDVQREIQRAIDEIDRNLAAAAKDLSRTGLGSPEASSVLARICPASRSPYLVDCCTVDSKGRILAIEPQSFKESEGADISGQEQIVRLHRTKQPVMSRTIAMVEGFDAVDLEQPVFSETGELMGSVSVLIKPEVLLAGVVQPAVKGFPVDIWVMERDGRTLYDSDEKEIGKNLFQDYLYKPFEKLRSLAKKMSSDPSGTGYYSFYRKDSDTVINKHASWTTVGLHGTEWRVVMIQEAAEGQPMAQAESAPADIGEIIENLCADPELQNALARDDEAKAVSIFKKAFEQTPELYSVQWIDAHSVNRFGYPTENSLRDYSFREGRSAGDDQFRAAVDRGRKSSFELPMLEGGAGVFYLHPVRSGDQYLGIVYAIRKENAKTP